MGNIIANLCNIMSGKTENQEKIVIGKPIISRFDINQPNEINEEIKYTNIQKSYSLPNLNNREIIILNGNNKVYSTNYPYFINNSNYYQNPYVMENSMLNGFLTGMLFEEIID